MARGRTVLRRVEGKTAPVEIPRAGAIELDVTKHSVTDFLTFGQSATILNANVAADHIAQLIRNLVSNALRYTPNDGRVSAQVRNTNGAIEISVTDNGTGFAPEDLPHVFDRFYRGGTSRTRDGSGLGLAIVKQLVEAHGGRVGVESAIGKGTQFWFALPG